MPGIFRTTHLYVSPHLDDAALSAGGAIHTVTSGGDRVTVATVFAAPLQLASQLPQAVRFHAIMGLRPSDDPLRRLREDERALATLGATPVQLPFDDCVYRTRGEGAPVVSDDDDVFSDAGADEEAELVGDIIDVLAALFEELAPDKVILPLALGSHRDHVIARAAGELAHAHAGSPSQLAYYEDVPYCLRVPVRPLEAVPGLVAITPQALEARLRAVGEYASQGAVVWRGPPPLEDAIESYCCLLGRDSPTGLAERQWRP